MYDKGEDRYLGCNIYLEFIEAGAVDLQKEANLFIISLPSGFDKIIIF